MSSDDGHQSEEWKSRGRRLQELKGDANWEQWKFKAQATLTRKRLWEVVRSTHPQVREVLKPETKITEERAERARVLDEEARENVNRRNRGPFFWTSTKKLSDVNQKKKKKIQILLIFF